MSSKFLKIGLLAALSAAAAWAQPTIARVVNSASYVEAPSDGATPPNKVGNNNVAQGAIFVAIGTGLGPAALVQAQVLPLPTSLPSPTGSTSVSIKSGGQSFDAFMIYSFSGAVAAILPSTVPVGNAQVVVTYNGQASAPSTISVVKSRVGIYTLNSGGTGPAAIQFGGTANLVNLTTPATPGSILTLYGTGLGAITIADNIPPGAVLVGSNVKVNVAGKQVQGADILYAGRSPNFPGLDQINFRVPADAALGCYIPAEVTASGIPSQQFTISISSDPTACVHPLGLSKDALTRLDTPGGTANVGLFLFLRAVVAGIPAEGAGGLFNKADFNSVFQMYNRITVAFGGSSFPVAVGSCAVLDTIDPPSGFAVPDFTLLGGKEINAGDGMTIAPGSSFIVKNPTGGYLNVFFGTFGPGPFTLTSAGGPEVGAFTATTTMPDNLVWTNVGSFAKPPLGDLTIAWTGGTGGSAGANAIVTVFGSSVVVNPNDPSKNRGAQFFCNAPATAGKFVVPAAVVQRLPSSTGLAAGEVAFGNLGINSGGGSPFTAPLTSGKLDAGFLSYGEAHTIAVQFQ
jgi:uncharacterized protein (TIGR03437 family)